MQIIIPMSGHGSRFKEAGYKWPKPLIEVDGKPIIEHVVSMFPGATKFLFICNEDHLASTPMKSVLARIAPSGQIFSIPSHKKGPVYAVLQAKDAIDDKGPCLVSYCDFFSFWDFKDFCKRSKEEAWDGAIPCYKGFHPHLLFPNLYAGCRTDNDLFLSEIREKFSFTENKMDTWQSSGLYYFGSGSLLKHYFQKTMDLNLSLNQEFYVSLVYNLLVQDRLRVKVVPHPYFCQWGTPFDLEYYQKWSSYFASLVK